MRRHASVLHFPMFADSFRLVSIHCVARGLGAGFLYKCPASHGSTLRQHGLLVELFCSQTHGQTNEHRSKHHRRQTVAKVISNEYSGWTVDSVLPY